MSRRAELHAPVVVGGHEGVGRVAEAVEWSDGTVQVRPPQGPTLTYRTVAEALAHAKAASWGHPDVEWRQIDGAPTDEGDDQ